MYAPMKQSNRWIQGTKVSHYCCTTLHNSQPHYSVNSIESLWDKTLNKMIQQERVNMSCLVNNTYYCVLYHIHSTLWFPTGTPFDRQRSTHYLVLNTDMWTITISLCVLKPFSGYQYPTKINISEYYTHYHQIWTDIDIFRSSPCETMVHWLP